jgi:hypothetical protein
LPLGFSHASALAGEVTRSALARHGKRQIGTPWKERRLIETDYSAPVPLVGG